MSIYTLHFLHVENTQTLQDGSPLHQADLKADRLPAAVAQLFHGSKPSKPSESTPKRRRMWATPWWRWRQRAVAENKPWQLQVTYIFCCHTDMCSKFESLNSRIVHFGFWIFITGLRPSAFSVQYVSTVPLTDLPLALFIGTRWKPLPNIHGSMLDWFVGPVRFWRAGFSVTLFLCCSEFLLAIHLWLLLLSRDL